MSHNESETINSPERRILLGNEEYKALVSDITLLDMPGDGDSTKRLKALARDSTLRSLDLSRNIIGDAGAQILALNTTATLLDLWSNNISENGARALALDTMLTELRLGSNMIGDGAKAFARNTTLTKLYLWANQISDDVAEELALNTTLTFLNLDYNDITDKGAQAFCLNTILTNLSLKNTLISDEWIEKVENHIKLNKQHLHERRKHFIQCLIVLARDTSNCESNSLWNRLIPDMRRYIIDHMCRSWQLGIPYKDAQECVSYVSKNITYINKALRKGIPLTITQKEDTITLMITE